MRCIGARPDVNSNVVLERRSVKEEIEWFTPQTKKPEEMVPILVNIPSEESDLDLQQAQQDR